MQRERFILRGSVRGINMKGLCHICFSSNEILTLCEGITKCEKCYDYDQCHERKVQ